MVFGSTSENGRQRASGCGLALVIWLGIVGLPTSGIPAPAFAEDPESLRDMIEEGIGQTFPPKAGPLVLERSPTPLNVAVAPMMTVDVSPDGRSVATGSGHPSSSGEIVLWDVQTGRERFVRQYPHGVRSVRFSPDGQRLATGHFDSRVEILDGRTGEVLQVLQKHTDGVNAVAFSPDGTRLVSGGHDDVAILWDLESGDPVRTFAGHTDDVLSVHISPDGNQLASAGRDSNVRIWDLQSGEPAHVLTGHSQLIEYVRFSPDGKQLASAGWDGTTRLWDPQTGRLLHTLKGHRGNVTIAAFSPNGEGLATSGWDRNVIVWSTETAEPRAIMPTDHAMPVFGLEFTRDGKRIVTSSFDRTAKIWDFESSELVQTLRRRDEPRPAAAVAWSPDEQWVATTHENGLVRLTRTGTGEIVRTLENSDDPVLALTFSRDGEILFMGTRGGDIRSWQHASKQNSPPRVMGSHSGAVRGLELSSTGDRLASAADDGIVRLWSVVEGEETGTLDGAGDEAVSVDFVPGDRLLITGHASGRIRHWDTKSMKEIKSTARHNAPVTALAVSPDGATVAAADGPTVRLWERTSLLREPKERLTLAGFEGPVRCLAFSRGPRGLVTGDASGTLRLWDPEVGAALMTVRHHQGPITALTVAPHTQTVVTVSQDGSGALWHPHRNEHEILPLASIPAHEKGASFVALDAGQKRLVTNGYDNMVRIFNLESGEQTTALGRPNQVSACQLSPDGTLLATGYWSKSLQVMDLASGRVFHRLSGVDRGPSVLAFSPDGTLLASMPKQEPLALKIYDLRKSVEPVLSIGQQALPWVYVDFAPDSKSFVTCTGDYRRMQIPGQVQQWSAETGELLGSFDGHTSEVKFARFSADGKRLATTSGDKTARVWDVATRTQLSVLPHENGVFTTTFVPDSDLLITSEYDGTVSIWNLESNERVMRLRCHADFVSSLELSEDLSVMATASRDGRVSLWALSGRGNDLRIVGADVK